MYKRFSSNGDFYHPARFERVKYGTYDSVPINQASSMPFNVDPDTGRPMSVITSIIRSQNAVEQQAAFAQLNEFKSNFLPADMSNEDAFKFAFPSRCQLPSEIASLHEHFAKMKLDEETLKQEQLKQKELAEEQELFDEKRKEYVETLKKSKSTKNE